MLTGLLLGLLAALAEAGKDVFYSGGRMRELPGLIRATAMILLALPVALISLYAVGLPEIKPIFWAYVTMHASLMSFALLLAMRALSLAPVSQTQPILSLTTVLLVITNPLMTDDVVPLVGWFGVFLVAVGIYGTQHPGKAISGGPPITFWSPFIEMFSQAGVRANLAVAVTYSITANLDKLAIGAANGPFYLVIDLSLVSGILLAACAVKYRSRDEKSVDELFFRSLKSASVGGLIYSAAITFHLLALTFTTVPYVIAMKRLSIVFASFWGYLVRKDRELNSYRLVGIGLVISGVFVICLFG